MARLCDPPLAGVANQSGQSRSEVLDLRRQCALRVHTEGSGATGEGVGGVAPTRMRSELDAAVAGAPDPLSAADRLCRACVTLLDVDGASISLIDGVEMRGTFGSSSVLSRTLDELQFTFGEGPCVDAVVHGRPVLVDDLDDAGEQRWPALTGAFLERGVRAVFALPVAVSATCVGALDLYRRSSGPLSEPAMSGGLWAARLAARPLLDLMTADVDWQAAGESEACWDQLASLERVEVYQATGFLIGALDVTPAEALVRLRAYAIGHSLPISDAAYAVLDRRLLPSADGDWIWVDGRDTR